MERESVMEKRRVTVNDDLILEYSLSKRLGTNGLILYSLLIEESLNGACEFVFLDALTAEEEEAKALFHLFVRETVTPCTAEDLVHEILYAP